MKTTHLSLLNLLCFTVTLLLSSHPCAAEPQKPALASAPTEGSWTMEVVKGSQPPPRIPQKISSKISGGVEERTIVFGEDSIQRAYLGNNELVAQFSPTGDFQPMINPSKGELPAELRPGFFGFQQISAATFEAKESVAGIACKRFALPPLHGRADTQILPGRTVWIHAESGQPVALRIGSTDFRFTISDKAPVKITMPPTADSAWRRMKDARRVAMGTGVPSLPMPTGPLLAPLPDAGSWTMNYQPVKEDPGSDAADRESASPPHLLEISSKTSRGLEERIVKYASGATQSIYRAGKSFLAQTSPGGAVIFFQEDPARPAGSLFAPGYFGFQGLALEHYTGPEVLFEIPCHRFDLPAVESQGEGFTELASRTVWIDPKTKLPVALQLGQHTYRFVVSTSPPGGVRLSQDARQVWEKQKQALAIAFGNKAVKSTPFDQ